MTKDQEETKLAKQPKEPTEPFPDNEVKSRLKRFLGVPETIVFSNHALKRMEDHDMETTDVFSTMRGGAVRQEYREHVAGRWRYCVGTRKFRVMFVFEDNAVVIITAIRLEQKP